jgi:hypothetical protein
MKVFLPVYSKSRQQNYPVTRRYIKAVLILNGVEHIQNGYGGIETCIEPKGTAAKILKKYMEMDMHIWDDNIKML